MSRVVCEIVDVYVFRRSHIAGQETVEFLMLHRSTDRYLGGTWQSVHGKIELNESAWQAALRELREETALVPRAFYQIDTVNTFYMANADVVHHCPCFAAEVAADAMVALNEEHDAFAWVTTDQALTRFIWPGQRRAVREILEEIIRPGPAIEFLRLPTGGESGI